MSEHPEDLPWNDVPADSDVYPGSEEPDPAEVVGDEDDEAIDDLSYRERRPGDDVHRDTLDERLREEIPDRTFEEQDPEAPELQSPESREAEDLEAPAAEKDTGEDPVEEDDEPAEEAAIHVVPDDRI
jgi:hypothetical protein